MPEADLNLKQASEADKMTIKEPNASSAKSPTDSKSNVARSGGDSEAKNPWKKVTTNGNTVFLCRCCNSYTILSL